MAGLDPVGSSSAVDTEKLKKRVAELEDEQAHPWATIGDQAIDGGKEYGKQFLNFAGRQVTNTPSYLTSIGNTIPSSDTIGNFFLGKEDPPDIESEEQEKNEPGWMKAFTIGLPMACAFIPGGLFLSSVIGGVVGGAVSIVKDLAQGKRVNWNKFARGAFTGALSSLFGGFLLKGLSKCSFLNINKIGPLKSIRKAGATTKLTKAEARLAKAKTNGQKLISHRNTAYENMAAKEKLAGAAEAKAASASPLDKPAFEKLAATARAEADKAAEAAWRAEKAAMPTVKRIAKLEKRTEAAQRLLVKAQNGTKWSFLPGTQKVKWAGRNIVNGIKSRKIIPVAIGTAAVGIPTYNYLLKPGYDYITNLEVRFRSKQPQLETHAPESNPTVDQPKNTVTPTSGVPANPTVPASPTPQPEPIVTNLTPPTIVPQVPVSENANPTKPNNPNDAPQIQSKPAALKPLGNNPAPVAQLLSLLSITTLQNPSKPPSEESYSGFLPGSAVDIGGSNKYGLVQ